MWKEKKKVWLTVYKIESSLCKKIRPYVPDRSSLSPSNQEISESLNEKRKISSSDTNYYQIWAH